MATRGGKTRRGQRRRWGGLRSREDVAREVQRRGCTPGGLLAGDGGRVALVTSTLSHLSYRHPHAYGRFEVVSAPPVPISF